jgi:hypothetical protein
MNLTAADFQHVCERLGRLGRRPLLIALTVYCLGFVGAGWLLWRGVALVSTLP